MFNHVKRNVNRRGRKGEGKERDGKKMEGRGKNGIERERRGGIGRTGQVKERNRKGFFFFSDREG